MNLGVLNRMNSNQKEDKIYQDKMYVDWSSFSFFNQSNIENRSVLTSLPLSPDALKQIVTLVVQPIATNIGITHPSPLSAKLNTDREVAWCMEVIGYGLSLPLNIATTEHDPIRDCVHVYCEWLSALLPQPRSAVPLPLLKLPNHYSRKIICQLFQIFIPRPGEAPDLINRQAVLCHRVLRTIQSVVTNSSIIDQDTWDSLLLLLMTINDVLLAPPTVPNDIGDQLCDRVLSVLFEIWLHACAKSFPSPRMWKTLTELAQSWRHRTSLITQWNRINLALTSRLLTELYGPQFLKPADDEQILVPVELSGKVLTQAWYRLLHCIGNPVQLARPSIISQTHKFLQYTIISSQLSDPSQHPCLFSLPNIFVEAMKGIAGLVDAFLGLRSSVFPHERTERRTHSGSIGRTSFPVDNAGSTSILHRARCNSLLHLFGSWLFEATLIDCETQFNLKTSTAETSSSSLHLTDRSRASSVSVTSESSLQSNRPRSATVVELPPDTANVGATLDGYESGRAEALGALCRIFCSKSTDEDILPQYLARFYVVLNNGLKIKDEKFISEAMASILLHSADLFRVNLDGVFTLIPSVIDSLEVILLSKDLKIKPSVNRVELRRASIHVLVSILAAPLHFHSLPIKELAGGIGERNTLPTIFSNVRPRLTQLLLSALQVESDPLNTHILLGGLASLIHDLAAFEQSEHNAVSLAPHNYPSTPMQTDSASNVMSSTSDTHSCHSTSSNSYPSVSEITLDSHLENDASYSERISYSGPLLTFPLGSFHGLVNATFHLVSCKLLAVWKADLNTSLAALELLGFLAEVLAKLRVSDQNVGESRRIVRVLCEYISVQCSRPPPAHSKDLHSTIVAAYTCCASWLFAHPFLATDSECLHLILQVIELGISGSKSQTGKNGESIQAKHEKLLKPVSLRVRDAAEFLLTSLIEQVGNFPSLTGPGSPSCILNEEDLFNKSNLMKSNSNKPHLSAAQHFRYFAASEGTIILGVLEQPSNKILDSDPMVTILIRNQFGRQVWASQIRHLPRHKCGVYSYTVNPGRPLPMNDVGSLLSFDPQYFPDSVDRVRPCLADKTLPSLETPLMIDDRIAAELDKLGRLVDSASTLTVSEIQEDIEIKSECQSPLLCNEFQTARLFLSHLGFLSVDGLQENSLRGNSLVGLDSTSSHFFEDLDSLDRLGSRSHDTVYVFYVRSGQKDSYEILSNMSLASSLNPHFLEFLQALGWPQDSLTTAQAKPMSKESMDLNSKANAYQMTSQCLYWADGVSEILFVVPALSCTSPSFISSPFHEPSSLNDSPQNQLGKEQKNINFSKRLTKDSAYISEVRMLVVWCESYEDHTTIPIGDLLETISSCRDNGGQQKADVVSDCFVIFIHAQQSGLYRIHLQGPNSKVNLATPLVDGIVVSRRALGSLVRQTAVNMGKRRRLDHDSYQLPHIRRKLKVSEIASKYRSDMDVPSFYSNLFCNPEVGS
ncbi:ral GTPase-activating protein subunit beta-like isoform X2 [Daphnia pulex]|uniref:ral GTPase-activating protein subunit beta-like isoform X2 n=1 Tax=Daphnia pulex TaxID=6669 RepID=UPI001EDF7E9E|nr:ral GTPase-activating protein subunit beta-like isoform X2 [Daphnia pulex]